MPAESTSIKTTQHAQVSPIRIEKDVELKTLSRVWTKDLIELKIATSIFPLFGGIHNSHLSIFTYIFYRCLFCNLPRKKWPYTAINSDVSCETKWKSYTFKDCTRVNLVQKMLAVAPFNS